MHQALRIMLWLALCLVSFTSFNQVYAAKPVPIATFTLKNGLTVVVASLHRAPVISHNIMIYAGAADDPLGHSGVAHFLEHMLFKGTPTFPEGSYSKEIERMGGQYNAFTSADMTGYYVTVAKEHISKVMELEADRMMNLAPKSTLYQTERDVVIEERRMRTDNSPAALLGEALNAALFRHHPYGTPIIGWAHEIALLDETSAQAFLRRFYTPSNAALILVGDITEAEARTLAQRYYGAWEGKPKQPRKWVSEPPRIASDTVVLRHPTVQQPQWTRSYLAPSLGEPKNDNTPHIMPLLIAEEVLGNARTGVLYRSLVEDKEMATSVSVSYNPFSIGAGTLDVSITPVAGVSMWKLKKTYEKVIDDFIANKIDKNTMQRARNQMKASSIFARDSMQGMAFILSQLVMIGMKPEWFNEWESLVDAVTPVQVTSAVQAVFKDDVAVTGILLPKE
jgi:zinc protease